MKERIHLASLVALALTSFVVGGICITASGAQAARGPGSRAQAGASDDSDDDVSIERVAKAGDGTLLKVKNRTPFMVIVYVGGVRIGWVRPYRQGLIRGLRPGHHRLYAHTRYGTTSWGPRFIWIPGTWNLLY